MNIKLLILMLLCINAFGLEKQGEIDLTMIDVNFQLREYPASPFAQSHIAEQHIYLNSKEKLPTISPFGFSSKYNRALVYWGNIEKGILSGFTYFNFREITPFAKLHFHCETLLHKDEKYYLLIAKSDSLGDLHSMVVALVKTRPRNFDLKQLLKVSSKDIVMNHFTHPDFYEQDKWIDYDGDKVIAQITTEQALVESLKPIKKQDGHRLKLLFKAKKIKGIEGLKDIKLTYNFETKKFTSEE
jgi:hypothetical protein